jgi:CBS domain containing-hemolysin-like protein
VSFSARPLRDISVPRLFVAWGELTFNLEELIKSFLQVGYGEWYPHLFTAKK